MTYFFFFLSFLPDPCSFLCRPGVLATNACLRDVRESPSAFIVLFALGLVDSGLFAEPKPFTAPVYSGFFV